MKKGFVLLGVTLFSISMFACSFKFERNVNVEVNDTNVLDAKAGIDTENPDLVSASINTSKFRTINFGKQDGRPISWYVISDDDDGYQLLVTEKIIDTMQFNTEDVRVEWSDSTLYDYLNSDFINECFSGEEQSKIVYVNDLDDAKVTMLSLNNLIDLYGRIFYIPDEFYGVKDYFEANKDIIAKPNEKAIKNSIEIYENATFAELNGTEIDNRYDFANGHSPYWLINTADDTSDVFLVDPTGYITYLEPNRNYIGVRPVIRIKK